MPCPTTTSPEAPGEALFYKALLAALLKSFEPACEHSMRGRLSRRHYLELKALAENRSDEEEENRP